MSIAFELFKRAAVALTILSLCGWMQVIFFLSRSNDKINIMTR